MSKIKSILRLFKRLSDRTLGTKTDELYWRFRHLFDETWAERYFIDAAINHPHRQLLIETIARYEPLKSILEIGCASGPNLYLLAKKLPNAQLYGIDISKKAIKVGAGCLNKKGIKNVTLSYGRADNLNSFSDKSIDVIFTDAMLIYIGPDKIDKVVKEMIRVARKAVILIEWMSKETHSYQSDHWAYNWESLFSKYNDIKDIRLIKLTENIWSGDWAKYGYIIEVPIY